MDSPVYGKSLFRVCTAKDTLVMGVYLQCGKNNIYHHHFLVGMVNMEEYKESLIDLPVHGAQIEPLRSLFQSCVMIDYLGACNLFSILLLYKLS